MNDTLHVVLSLHIDPEVSYDPIPEVTVAAIEPHGAITLIRFGDGQETLVFDLSEQEFAYLMTAYQNAQTTKFTVE